MNNRIKEAVLLSLRADALEAFDRIAQLLGTTPSAEPDVATQVKEALRKLLQAEGAMITLNQHFPDPVRRPTQPVAPSPIENPEDIKVITPEMSPTLREALAAEAARKKREGEES